MTYFCVSFFGVPKSLKEYQINTYENYSLVSQVFWQEINAMHFASNSFATFQDVAFPYAS